MATHKREFSGATHKQYLLDDNYESQEEEMYQLDSEDDYEEEEEKRGGRWSSGRRKGWSLGQVLDPRAKWVREWNRVNLLFILTGLFLDPLFFYALSTSDSYMCLFIDGWFAITITVLRCMTDAFHVWNMWLQLKMDTRLYSYTVAMAAAKDEDEGGGGDGASHTATAGRRVAVRYLKDWKGFFFDLFVILPIPQMVLWVIIPSMLKEGSVTVVMTIFLITFLFQYLPKIYHSARRLRHLQNLSGHVFGTISGGIFLNFIAYFVVAHAAGACWYMLGTQRSTKCLSEQCRQLEGCDLRTLACKEPIYYGTTNAMRETPRLAWAGNRKVRSTCIDSPDIYQFGGYKWAAQLVTNESRLEKILYPIFWGIMTLSTFGNLESSTNWLEVVFKIIVLIIALVLFTMLIGNIKVFLQATTTRKQAMQLKMRNIEWWMRKRHLPQGFRQRVRNFERQKWEAMRGVDEHQMIRNLPEGLRRSIKYHLCLDLVRQVPLFQHMDDLVLENICERVKSLIFTKGETITRQGDPVQRMLFVVRGHLQSSQVLRDGVKSCCMLGPGNFSGDELLSWCLRRPFIKRLPPSSSTLVTLETTEAFGLEAEDVKYVVQHFRYTFVNEKVKRSARYYSPGWRTWAAVAIQLAWRRYKHRLRLTSLSFIRPRSPLSRSNSLGDQDMLRLYAAMLAAKKPNQDDFDF